MTRSEVQVLSAPPFFNRRTITLRFWFGAIAQLARAPALQAGGPGFESPLLHQRKGTRYGVLFLWCPERAPSLTLSEADRLPFS